MTGTEDAAHPTEAIARPSRRHDVWAFIARHRVFLVVLTLGVIGRGLVEIAFPYPFVQPDSHRYLDAAIDLRPDFDRTSGYSLFVRLIPGWRELWPLPIVHHLIGLTVGVLIYALLSRRRVPRWGAALATIPVLLDPFQIAIEHYVLSDTLFLALLVGGLTALAIRRRVSIPLAVLGGALLGCALLVRSAGNLVVVVAAIVLLVGQARWRPTIAFALAVVVPVAAYMLWFHQHHGMYSTNRFPENALYQRVVRFADCPDPDLPSYERPLCPQAPKERLKTAYYYAWSRYAPWRHLNLPPGTTRWEALHDFNRRMMRQQPLGYARVVAGDALRVFALRRHGRDDGSGQIENWRFNRDGQYHRLSEIPGMPAERDLRINRALAGRLALWSRLYVPGPVLFACMLVGLVAAVGLGRARRNGTRAATALVAMSCLAILFTSNAVSIFSWRYQLPLFALLPAAGALGAAALLRKEPAPDVLTARETFRRLFAPIRGLVRGSFQRGTGRPPGASGMRYERRGDEEAG